MENTLPDEGNTFDPSSPNTPDAPPSRAESLGASRVRFVSTEPDDLSLHRVAKLRDKFVAASKRIAREEATKALALAEIQQLVLDQAAHRNEVDLALRSRAAECAAALGVSDRAVHAQMADAHTLVYEFPATHAALGCAAITMQHARVIINEGSVLGEDLRETFEERCLEIATDTSPGRLRRKARAIAQALEPQSIDELHRLAVAGRCVWVRDLPDGMAELGAVLPAVLAYGIRDRVGRIAKAAKQHVARAEAEAAASGTTPPEASAPETVAERLGIGISPATELPDDFDELTPEDQAQARERVNKFTVARDNATLDAYRADVFAELLLTGILADADAAAADDHANDHANQNSGNGQSTATREVIGGIQANVSIVIPVGGTATLDGYGPIDSSTARQFAAATPGWDTTIITARGEVVSTDRRQPTEAMKRILRARDQHCRFPSCSAPTAACEIDHTIEWSLGGPTEIANLGFLCIRHHALKHPDLAHQIRWRVEQDSHGNYFWISPTGAEFTDRPEHAYQARHTSPKQAAAPPTPRQADEDCPF